MKRLAPLALLLPLALVGCAGSPSPSPEEAARGALRVCGANNVAQVAPLARSYGKTDGAVFVCKDGRVGAIP